MAIFLQEIKRNRLMVLLWAVCVGTVLATSVVLYPQMASQVDQVNEAFANMGSFTSAFGMDKVNFGEFAGYFAVECGNSVSIGGALFAAILGIFTISKEEKDQTAEFLLTHPVSRKRVLTEKLGALLVNIVIFNAILILFALLSIVVIGESIDANVFCLLFASLLMMDLEIAVLSFGISAFLRSSGMGIGLGLALMFYFMNIISNITEDAKFLKYITPFGYTEATTIVVDKAIPVEYLWPGIGLMVLAVLCAFAYYPKKDI